MRKDKAVSGIKLALLLALSLVGNVVPQVNATPSGHDFLTEIGTFRNLHAVDVNSEGKVFIKINNTIWRSINNGASFTKVLDTGVTGGWPIFLRVDSNDRIFANIWDGSAYDVYRSIDDGDSWRIVLENTPRLWRLAEMSNGTLFINTYDTPKDDLIYKSNDGGATWSIWQNLTGQVTDHIHFVRVNPYNDDVWIGCGDKSGAPLGYYNGTAWTWVFNATGDWHYTDAIFDEKYVYLIPDRHAYSIQRLPHRGTWAQRMNVFDLWNDDIRSGGYGIPFSMMAARYNDGVMVVPTDRTTVYASIDGINWLKVAELPHEGKGAWRLAYISQRRPIYIVNYRTDKLYRLNIQKEDIIKIFGKRWTELTGKITNAENYSVEIPITNGQRRYLDLTGVGLESATVNVIGLSMGNFISNSGWETGNTTGWSFSGNGTYAVTTNAKFSGTYGLAVNKTYWTAHPPDHLYLYQQKIKAYSANEYWLISARVKANRTVTNGFRIQVGYYDEKNFFRYVNENAFTLYTSWYLRSAIRHSWAYANIGVRFCFYASSTVNYTAYIDDILVERKINNRIISKVADGDTVVNKNTTTPVISPYYDTTINTKDLIVNVNGITVSHSGDLVNDGLVTQSIGNIAGGLEINSVIGGSGQAILRINGTRVLYDDSIILKGRKDNVYYGRYFGNFSPTTTTTDLIAVTNLASNITSLSSKSNKLTLAIHSFSGTTSITKVYVGDKGQPKNVKGATSWSYDSASKILTITALHSSSITILVKWRLGNRRK